LGVKEYQVMPILAIYGIIAAVLVALGGGIGWKVTSDHYEAKHAKDDRVALTDFQTAVLGMSQLSVALEKVKSENRKMYRSIQNRVPEIVSRPVYIRECLDDDGLRLINEAFGGNSDSSKHVDGVSSVNPARGQDGS
jgi:hypothetical protein